MRQSAIDEYEQLRVSRLPLCSVDRQRCSRLLHLRWLALFDSSAAPNSAPQDYVGKDATVDGATIEEGAGYEEETTTNTTLGAGAIKHPICNPRSTLRWMFRRGSSTQDGRRNDCGESLPGRLPRKII
ncbi:hypothetical protein ACHAWO_002613 [Cyclotella atomus]|uniref:Uncharacterized protein n=1 Tax=Cyclotella atomus TaxID=382360 RepID=A0ABD3NKM6_9STRA